MHSSPLRNAVRLALMAGAATALAAPAVFAQNAAQTTNTQDQNSGTTQLNKVEVTGTRILRTSVETAQPVTIITSAQIKASGFTRVGDVLQNLTQSYSGTNLLVNNGNDGSNNLNLRGLGSKRLLVLVNGHRIATDLSNIVDMNNIPTSIIDHIEILQDGASAIYGSDAISGVVNIITISNFSGAEASAYMGMYDGKNNGGGWDGKDQNYSFTVGTQSDRSGLVLNVSYENQQPVSAGNRTISAVALYGVGGGSSSTPAGRFYLISPTLCNGVNAAGGSVTLTSSGGCDMTTTAPGTYPNGKPSLSNFRDYDGKTDAYNYAPANYLLAPLETTGIYIQGHYDLADNLKFTTDVLFNNRQSNEALAAAPLFMGVINNGQTNNGGNIGVGKDNPYNPFGVDLVPYLNSGASAAGFASWCAAYGSPSCMATGQTAYFLFRRPIEAGPRLFSQQYDDYHVGMGLQGYFDMLGSEWDWDVHSSFGREVHNQITTGEFNTSRIQDALSDSCPTTAGCVPYNIFGGATIGGLSSITPQQLAYISFTEHNIVLGDTRNYDANITGTLFTLPAGPVQMALGGEYLETDGSFQPDALRSSGNTTDNVAQPTDGREKTNGEYVEFNIPLVSDVPLMKNVSLDVANRWSQFKWNGIGPDQASVLGAAHATTARWALRWQTTDDLLLRASWSQGFRIPSVSEFFAGAGNGFPSVTDPCASKTPGGPPVNPAAQYCVANGHALGKVQPNGQIQTSGGGNSHMTPEHAISKTAGFVYNPSWLPGWDVSVDYYNINVVNTVGTVGPQNLVNGCYIDNAQSYCKQLQVIGGVINTITDTNTNIGAMWTSGYDFETHYKLPSTAIGDFNLGFTLTFLKVFDETIPDPAEASGFAISKLAGWGTQMPKRRANLSLGWHYGDWSAMLSEHFVDHMIEPCQNAQVGGATPVCTYNGVNGPSMTWGPQGTVQYAALNQIGSVTYTDIEGTYHVDPWNTDFTFGIQNLLDRVPPISISAFANSFGTAFNRVPGRMFYARVGVKF